MQCWYYKIYESHRLLFLVLNHQFLFHWVIYTKVHSTKKKDLWCGGHFFQILRYLFENCNCLFFSKKKEKEKESPEWFKLDASLDVAIFYQSVIENVENLPNFWKAVYINVLTYTRYNPLVVPNTMAQFETGEILSGPANWSVPIHLMAVSRLSGIPVA